MILFIENSHATTIAKKGIRIIFVHVPTQGRQDVKNNRLLCAVYFTVISVAVSLAMISIYILSVFIFTMSSTILLTKKTQIKYIPT